jgi:uncharacterized membrane protein (UPF0136 family)
MAGQLTMAVYALLLAAYAVIGYAKRQSLLALVAGTTGSLVAAAALNLSLANNPWGLRLGLYLSLVVLLVCSAERRREERQVRLRDHERELTGKAMQNQLLLVVSGLVLCALAAVQSVKLIPIEVFGFVVFAALAGMIVVNWLRP